jgi:hypothetical protein
MNPPTIVSKWAATAKAIAALGFLFALLCCDCAFLPPALGQRALTQHQSATLDAYRGAVDKFKSILRLRRTQIESNQPLPNLPGQAVYLARNEMISAYKDLTDALPSRIGRLNKFGIPPAYLDVQNELLLDEYKALFELLDAPPAYAQKSNTPFRDVVVLATAIARAKGLDVLMPTSQGVSVLVSFSPRPAVSKMRGMRARIPTREASRPVRPKTRPAKENGWR